MTSPGEQRDRARAGWDSLISACVRAGRGGLVVHAPRRRRSVPLWPFSQVLQAVAILDAVGINRMNIADWASALENYRRSDAYAERPGNRTRYYDDNAWIALAAMDLDDHKKGTWRDAAARVLAFLREGEREVQSDETGILWVEGGQSLNACSTGSTGLVALRLARDAHAGDNADLVEFAERCLRFLTGTLRGSDALVCDHLDEQNRVDPAEFTYNQGLAIGLHVGLAEVGPVGGVSEAQELAGRTLDAFAGERLWTHAPAFNAIFFRELLGLYAVDGDRRWTSAVDAYIDRVWLEARDPDTGLFTAGGIGRYDSDTALDQAGLVQLFALRGREN